MKSLTDAHVIDEIKRHVRLVLLLHASANAGMTPIPIRNFHAFSYLSNVLAPVWELEPFDKILLKRKGGPLYINVQHDLDRLVGKGIATVSDIKYMQNSDGQWELEGRYGINEGLAQPILDSVQDYADERQMFNFLEELAYALSALGSEELGAFIDEDATYGDQINVGEVIDFAEWKEVNCSVNAAENFANFMPEDSIITPGRKIHLYVHHLYRRAHVAG
ncbi:MULTISPECIES: hypothetical protein [Pseudodesulfovibrio]|uniref:Uncharacterized protein n=1 Tax=Pseudodesulfovibrio aespoeensis (strain ATCC 700646 / DSM 10631 / Aspo-2) TaxID=643562 RepID=E6VVH9_PSEA9|nr:MULTISPECIES: hypothetical protein [Pseudodesulfovibrio]ADU63537.1 hypothetical protein Daes_2535 [Pseudodesulfovibrio aespoeensis Aspo-2]MBV1765603.1 hypothetical protein [Pseudodesulfovibrio sp.]MCG2734001.1 hypothetical protein [Pseudodesulfovibrio aespoeensis]